MRKILCLFAALTVFVLAFSVKADDEVYIGWTNCQAATGNPPIYYTSWPAAIEFAWNTYAPPVTCYCALYYQVNGQWVLQHQQLETYQDLNNAKTLYLNTPSLPNGAKSLPAKFVSQITWSSGPGQQSVTVDLQNFTMNQW